MMNIEIKLKDWAVNEHYTQKGVLIFGMHRSGTSALMGVLQKSFIDLGLNLIGAEFDNTVGFFEYQDLVDINMWLLDAISSSWDDPHFDYEIPDHIKRDLNKLNLNIRDRDFAGSPVYGIKDAVDRGDL
jgi:hypothetical protein